MARSAQSYNRKKPFLKPQPLVLVICEDKKSSKNYLDDAAAYYRVKIKVEITHCGKTDPKGIVDEAIDNLGKYDNIFCVIDRDTHDNFDVALATAKAQTRVTVVPSYPCFEYWLLIHFAYSRKPYAAAGNKSAGDLVMDDLKRYPAMKKYEKGADDSIFRKLLGGPLEKAFANAKKCNVDAKKCGDLNPSTELHNLLAYFESLAEPELL